MFYKRVPKEKRMSFVHCHRLILSTWYTRRQDDISWIIGGDFVQVVVTSTFLCLFFFPIFKQCYSWLWSNQISDFNVFFFFAHSFVCLYRFLWNACNACLSIQWKEEKYIYKRNSYYFIMRQQYFVVCKPFVWFLCCSFATKLNRKSGKKTEMYCVHMQHFILCAELSVFKVRKKNTSYSYCRLKLEVERKRKQK